jgi:hypothetical protein
LRFFVNITYDNQHYHTFLRPVTASEDKITAAGRMARFEQWETYGADRLKSDLQADPYRRVGGKPVQDLAWEFVRMKEAEQAAKLEANSQEMLRALGLAPPSVSDLLSGQHTELDRIVKAAMHYPAFSSAETNSNATPMLASKEKGGELFIFKPNFHGIGIDLKEAGRRARRLVRRFWKKEP